MSHFVQRQPARRAPRVNVSGTIAAVIRLENGRQHSAKLQQLSITGGLLDIANYVEERSWVDVTIYLSSGPVRGTAEMMFPMLGAVGYLQPFRFTSLEDQNLHALDREVTTLLKQSATSKAGDLGLRAPRYYLESW
ncbi:MAG TPA: hypothetical protein VMG82_24155 [Candidatus Sulfotelmatobacter sp.]|nr:hypothetical protein [Candidatus Sulfotelmatobacter sp.]